MYITEGDTPCKNSDPEMWFAKAGTYPARAAKKLCSTCPEIALCLESTLRHEKRMRHTQPGIYGGMSEDERMAFVRTRQTAITAG